MYQKVTDGKYYRIYKDPDCHVNTKVNEKGRRAAIQFDDKDNKLAGPVEIEEVDINEMVVCNKSSEIDLYVQLILKGIVVPIMKHAFELGLKNLKFYLSDKVFPSTKNKIKRIFQSNKIYVEGILDGLAGKETKANRLLSNTIINEKNKLIELDIRKQNFHSSPEIEQILDILKKNVFVTATCIRGLTEIIMFDGEMDSQKMKELKKQLEELIRKELMNQICLMLEEKNRDLLDKEFYQVLSAFSQEDLFIGDKMIPIKKYIEI